MRIAPHRPRRIAAAPRAARSDAAITRGRLRSRTLWAAHTDAPMADRRTLPPTHRRAAASAASAGRVPAAPRNGPAQAAGTQAAGTQAAGRGRAEPGR
ncbi:hypothetical protein FE772_20460 [Lysobacter enzymogenes]|nr:hypothetical protein FE772_20460 [Lysobacter enzymogenes]